MTTSQTVRLTVYLALCATAGVIVGVLLAVAYYVRVAAELIALVVTSGTHTQ